MVFNKRIPLVNTIQTMITNGTKRLSENSKTFKRLGNLVGIKATHKSQRGIIARKYLHNLRKEHLQRIEQGLQNRITFKNEFIPIKQGGKVIDYI